MTFQGSPILVDGLVAVEGARRLERIPMTPGRGGGDRFSEDWLQRLVDRHPECLPAAAVDPAFSGLRAVCRELPMRVGFVDNLLATADGRLCLVETKLWRNAEARREVIGQILDYAAELAGWSYEDLGDAIRRALTTSGTGLGAAWRMVADPLHARVHGVDPAAAAPGEGDPVALEQAEFADAVARNLANASFLLLVVGDGIREETRGIVDLLLRRAGLGFSLGLVEMGVYREAGSLGPVLVQPHLLARTERLLLPAPSAPAVPGRAAPAARPRPATLSEQEFMTALAEKGADLPSRLLEFLDACRRVGCDPTLVTNITLYVTDANDRRWNLAQIDRQGRVWIWGPAGYDAEYGVTIGEDYLERLARSLPGLVVDRNLPARREWKLRLAGRVALPLRTMLDCGDAWLDALAEAVSAIQALKPRS